MKNALFMAGLVVVCFLVVTLSFLVAYEWARFVQDRLGHTLVALLFYMLGIGSFLGVVMGLGTYLLTKKRSDDGA